MRMVILNPFLNGSPQSRHSHSHSFRSRAILESLARISSFSFPFHSRTAHELRQLNRQACKRSACVSLPKTPTDRSQNCLQPKPILVILENGPFSKFRPNSAILSSHSHSRHSRMASRHSREWFILEPILHSRLIRE